MLRRAVMEFGVESRRASWWGTAARMSRPRTAAGFRQAFLVKGTEDAECDGEFLTVGSLAEVERWLMEQG